MQMRQKDLGDLSPGSTDDLHSRHDLSPDQNIQILEREQILNFHELKRI